jgi:hypothetical protein
MKSMLYIFILISILLIFLYKTKSIKESKKEYMYNTNYNAAQKWAKENIKWKNDTNQESASGTGSTIKIAKHTIELINYTINNYNIKNIADFGCGDWNWMRKVNLEKVNYIGYDASEDLIKENNIKYSKKNIKFEQKDITKIFPCNVDLVIARDVLFHIENNLVSKILNNLKKANVKYLITTTFPKTETNKKLNLYSKAKDLGWGFREINIEKEPFNIKNKIKCKKDIEKRNRYICLYKLNNKYIKKIKRSKNKVKKIIYVLWTGTNPMNKNRLNGIESMKKITGVKVKIINTNNLCKYILPDYPLHTGYEYLSRIHKADYLRCYFMHHYGGGYSDIKQHKRSWLKYFDIINKNKNIWMIGLGGFDPPSDAFSIAYPEEYNEKQRNLLKKYHNRMVGVGFMICRPRSPYTTEWYNNLHKRLDDLLPKLKKYPAIYSREARDRIPYKFCKDEKDPELKKLPCPTEPTKYPISWNRILGQIAYPLQVKYIDNIKQGLPMPNWDNYS